MIWPMGKLPRVKAGCCCCTLRTGALVVAWLNLIFFGLIALGEVIILLSIQGVVKIESSNSSALWSPTSESHKMEMTIILFGYVPCDVALCIVAIILLLGILQNNSSKVLTWLKAAIVLFIIRIAWGLLAMVAVWLVPDHYADTRINEFLRRSFNLAFFFVFEGYCIIVVNSYHQAGGT